MYDTLRQTNTPPATVSMPSDDESGMIFDIRRFSIQDGPGIRTTVFFKGCPLDCWWCHNPESRTGETQLLFRRSRCRECGDCVMVCPEKAIDFSSGVPATNLAICTRCGMCVEACVSQAREMAGRVWPVDEVMALIRMDVPFYDQSGGGVTFSGGEPLLQPAFLAALLTRCRAEEIRTALDTSGYASWKVIEELLPLVGVFLYDLKIMDDEKHRRYTGVSNRLILENLRRLDEAGAHLVIRTPVIPGINDNEENMCAAADFTAGLVHLERLDLLPYHGAAAGKYEGLQKKNRLPDVKTPSGEAMANIAGIFESRGVKVHIGGLS